eukprot:TRINITY_DN3817_c1_g1_i1.p2 TRINITY_DN3817_c1_g1~~TRINITY_DN3817_c1_g1_i1.p2  ORF type:complete len:105 (+),score=2.31 TRINITY_DN3817_c1_g1_i1:335-649(+)
MLGLSTFKQQDGHLPQVEVDEMPGLMGDVGPEIPTHDAMPGGVVLFVELFLNVGSNVLLNVVFFKCLSGTVHGVLLHLLGHVRVLDDGFAVRHDVVVLLLVRLI